MVLVLVVVVVVAVAVVVLVESTVVYTVVGMIVVDDLEENTGMCLDFDFP